MTRILQTLELQGYIIRAVDVKDGRRRKIAVTEAGRELVERTLPTTIQPVQLALSGLSASEKQQLEKLLQ